MENKINLTRKQNLPFTVNYPYQVANGVSSSFVWQGTHGTRMDTKAVPYEVFEWLRDYTSTFKEGQLVVEEPKDTDDEEIKEIKEEVMEKSKIANSILTEEELKDMFTKGNQNVLKGKLNKLVEDLDGEETKEVKQYIHRSAMNIGIDSVAKRKVICEFCGLNYEDVGDNFDTEK